MRLKYILALIVVVLSSVFCLTAFGAIEKGCSYDGSQDLKDGLNTCLSDTNLVGAGSTTGYNLLNGGFNTLINKWIGVISGILAIIAVGGIVYGGFMMVISQGEEEKFTKAKEIIKWSLIGFLALVCASTLIAVVVNVIYGL